MLTSIIQQSTTMCHFKHNKSKSIVYITYTGVMQGQIEYTGLGLRIDAFCG